MEKTLAIPVHAKKKGLCLASALLSASMLATGACGLVSEYILSTVSSYIMGNTIEQFSIVISLMMLMMGVANYLQKFMSDDSLVEKFIIVEIIIAVLGGFAPIIIYAAFGWLENNYSLVLYLMASGIGFLIGLEIPLVMRINEKYSDSLPINLARVISFDYLGSFVGAMAWIYLLRRFPLTDISFIVSGVNFAVAIVAFFYFIKLGLVKKPRYIIIAIAIVSSALVYGYLHNHEWEVSLEQRLYNDRIVFSKTSKYQRMVMTHDATLDDYRLYLNGNLQFSSKDEHVYHELLVHPALMLHGNPQKVLILGGGDGMALREVLKHKKVQEVTLVDLDQEMTRFCATDPIMIKLNNGAFQDARIKVLDSEAVQSSGHRPVFMDVDDPYYGSTKHGEQFVQKVATVDILNVDADNFIRKVNDKWDVVIIDFPDPNSIELAKLYSKEFFLKLEKVMAPGSLFVIQSTSPYHAKEAYLCVQRTIEAAGFKTMPFHENVPSFGDWGWFLGWRTGERSSWNPVKALDSAGINVDTKYITPDVFHRAATFGKNDLVSQYSDISTLMQPVILDRYLRYSWLVE